MVMLIFASDHAGFELKTELIKYINNNLCVDNSVTIDLGIFNADEAVDYPDYSKAVVDKLLSMDVEDTSFGVLICGSGIGMSIAANRFKKVRAALCINNKMARLARTHNNANILVLGARLTPIEEAKSILQTFIDTSFNNEARHLMRIGKIDDLI